MKSIFINLKRFDVPRSRGGVCPKDNPAEWIEEVIQKSVELKIGLFGGINVVYFVPESLIVSAQKALARYAPDVRGQLQIGCQSVFRNNIEAGKNFGAFTSNMPAASAYQMGCRWSMIGHSEERRDKQEIIGAYEPAWNMCEALRVRCAGAVDKLINSETVSGLEQGMDVLLCIGETAEERGDGSLEEQKPRIRKVLSLQLERGLKNTASISDTRSIVIGYEPIWAIGPGKTPPDKSYIAYVSETIKEITEQLYGTALPVVYGGGLKEENAAMLGSIETVDGGLVALTRFSGEIGFNVEDLQQIIQKYTGQ